MKTYITFQYKPTGRRPDDVTLTDVMTPVTLDTVVPIIGDIVHLQLASTSREFRDSMPGDHKAFQVVGRGFRYATKDGMGSGEATHCGIYVMVSDVVGDVPGTDIKE